MGDGLYGTRGLVIAAGLIALLYAPTVCLPFDFIDDSILVYPTAASSPRLFFEQVWTKTSTEFQTNGPFRPITWLHWDAAAQAFGDSVLPHRLLRLLWAWFTAGCLLWFLKEMGFTGWPAILTAALAMWNSHRGEIWVGLGLTEAFGMPYGLLALIGARKAARFGSFNRWDAVAFVFALLALGVKNTFAAIIPAQFFLRLAGDGLPARETFRERLGPALLLAGNFLWPVLHLAWIKLDGLPRTYQTQSLAPRYILRFGRALGGAIHIEWMAPALAIGAGLLWWTRSSTPHDRSARAGLLITAALLLAFGFLVYWPMQSLAGRYMIPAAWGLDLLIVLTLDAGFRVSTTLWRKALMGAFAAGLAVTAFVNLARQEWMGQRSQMLWNALVDLETRAAPTDTVLFVGKKYVDLKPGDLGESEGIHFRMHLQQRNRRPLAVTIVSEPPREPREQGVWLLSGLVERPAGTWSLTRVYETEPMLRRKKSSCRLWSREGQQANLD